MEQYKKMYYALFNEVTKAIEELQKAQKKTESMYMGKWQEQSGSDSEANEIC